MAKKAKFSIKEKEEIVKNKNLGVKKLAAKFGRTEAAIIGVLDEASQKQKKSPNTVPAMRHPLADSSTVKDSRYGKNKKIGAVMTRELSELSDSKKNLASKNLQKCIHKIRKDED